MVEAMAKEGPDHKAPSDGAEGNGKKRRDVPGDLHLTAWIMLNIRRLLDLLCLSSSTCLPTGCSGGVIRTTSNRPSQEPGASSLSALLLYLSLFLLLLSPWLLLLSWDKLRLGKKGFKKPVGWCAQAGAIIAITKRTMLPEALMKAAAPTSLFLLLPRPTKTPIKQVGLKPREFKKTKRGLKEKKKERREHRGHDDGKGSRVWEATGVRRRGADALLTQHLQKPRFQALGLGLLGLRVEGYRISVWGLGVWGGSIASICSSAASYTQVSSRKGRAKHLSASGGCHRVGPRSLQ